MRINYNKSLLFIWELFLLFNTTFLSRIRLDITKTLLFDTHLLQKLIQRINPIF